MPANARLEKRTMSVPPADRVGSALTGVGPRLEGIAAGTLGLVIALCLAGLAGLLTFDAVAAALGVVAGGGLILGHAVVRGALERAGRSDPRGSGDASTRPARRPDRDGPPGRRPEGGSR
jgi:hypothetical protein